jgi:cystathionine beta-synthase
MSRRLIREEGMLVGGSAGSTMAAAVKIAKTLKKGQRLVVLFADSVRNYMTKFLNDSWMIESGFMEARVDPTHKDEWWACRPVSDLQLNTPIVVGPEITCSECVDILNKSGVDQMPCVNKEGDIEGQSRIACTSHSVL